METTSLNKRTGLLVNSGMYKELPANMPELRGKRFVMRAKVNADHALDTVTRRSRTGFLVYLNCSLV